MTFIDLLTGLLAAGKWGDVAVNALGTVFGGMILPMLYFLVGPKVLRIPDLNGLWILDTRIASTNYSPHKNLLVRYRLMLLVTDGNRISGTAEKISEYADTAYIYSGKNRLRSTIEGSIRKGYLSRTEVFIHMENSGELRSTSSFLRLRCAGFRRNLKLVGVFSTTAADASGFATFSRMPIDQRANDPCVVPTFWLGQLVRKTTSHSYEQEWQQISQKLATLVRVAKRIDKSYNLNLVIAALVLAEDRRFYQHSGVDPIAICRAAMRRLASGQIEGGSTIEQQLVRTLLQDFRYSYARKYKEIVLAARLSALLDKEQIAVAYLLVAYMGWKMNGLLPAARYLNIKLANPKPENAAAIVARIKHPEPKIPTSSRRLKIETREKYILSLISAHEYLTFANPPAIRTPLGLTVTTAESIEGLYIRPSSANETAEISIEKTTSGYRVKGTALWGMDRPNGPNTGELDFKSTFENNCLLYQWKYPGGQVYEAKLLFEDGGLKVTEKNWHGIFGMNVRFEGQYERA